MRASIKLKLILFVTSAATFVSADSNFVLKIRPSGDVFFRPIGGSIMFTCELSPREVREEVAPGDTSEVGNFTDVESYNSNNLTTISNISDDSHVTSQTNHVTRPAVHVTKTSPASHVMTLTSHVTTPASHVTSLVSHMTSHLQVITDSISSESIDSNAGDSIRENIKSAAEPVPSNQSSHYAPPQLVEFKSTLHWWGKDKFEIRPRRTPSSKTVYVEEEEITEEKKYKKLYLSSIQNEHAGEYRCIERGPDDVTIQSVAVILRLYKKIQFDRGGPSVVLASLSGSAFLPCKATGYPVPIVTWRFNGSRILTKPNGRIVQTSSGLKIDKVTSRDVGAYHCRAVVEASGDYEEKIVELLVRARPEFAVDIGEVIGIKTQELFIQCTASGGVPAPKYSLFKTNLTNSTAVSEELIPSHDRIRINVDTGLITIRDVRLSDDRSQYVCVANNELGETRNRITIVVHEIPQIASFDDVTALRSGSCFFRCESPGNPAPNITFHRLRSSQPHRISTAGEPSTEDYDISDALEFVYGQNEDDRIVVTSDDDSSATLYIFNVTSEDAGVYSCTATNKYGTDRRRATLNVVYSPITVSLTPTWAYLAPRGLHNLTCIVDSNPPAAISWIHLNVTLSDSEIFHIHSTAVGSILMLETGLSSHNDSFLYGIYTCLTSNEYGSSQLDSEVLEATVPAAPLNVSVSEYTTSSVRLQVTSPDWDGGLPLTGYQVQYEEIQHTYKQGSIILINNLQPNTSYTMDIRAINELGAGRHYISINVTTKEVDNNYEIAAVRNDAASITYDSRTRTTVTDTVITVYSCLLTVTFLCFMIS